MSYKPSEEKKKEIVDFLEDKVEQGNLLELDKEEIKTRFSDEYHDEGQIKDIIKNLKEDDIIKSKNASLDVLVPEKYEEEVSKDWGEIFRPKTGQIMFLGFFIFAGLLSWELFYNTLKSISGFSADSQTFLKAMFWGSIGMYLSGKISVEAYSKLEEFKPKFREYKFVISPAIIFPLVSMSIVLYFNSSLSWITDSIPSILGVLITSVGAGITLGIFLHREERGERESQ